MKGELEILMNQYPQSGKLEFIGIRPGRRVPMISVEKVTAVEGKNLNGDRYRGGGNRQVTIIQAEHLTVIGSFLGKIIRGENVRRNLVVSGINLMSLKGKKFTIGEVQFEYSGECHPCSRMEEILGTGGYNAMRGMGGITAKIISSGEIRCGDKVAPMK